MESMNKISKGYDKLHNPSSQPNPDHRRRRRIFIFILSSSALLSILLVFAIVGAVIHPSKQQNPNPFSSSLLSNSNKSLKLVCSVTLHPDSCFASISTLNNPPQTNPAHFFNLSLQFNLQNLKNISQFPQTLVSNDHPTESALKDCVSLFSDSLSQVNQTAEEMIVGPGEKVFTERKISDMNSWISAAMTNLETCLDGLKEMGSTAVDQVAVRVQMSEEYLSNTLAILSNLQKLEGKLGLSLP